MSLRSCRSPEKGKENGLRFKKNLHLPRACTQGEVELLPREQSCGMLGGWSGRDRSNASWWASGCSSEGRQQADLELRGRSCEENTDRPWKKDCGYASKNNHTVGRQISRTLAFPMTREQIVSNCFQGVCVTMKHVLLYDTFWTVMGYTALMLQCHFLVVGYGELEITNDPSFMHHSFIYSFMG